MTRHFLKDDDLTPLEQEAIIEQLVSKPLMCKSGQTLDF